MTLPSCRDWICVCARVNRLVCLSFPPGGGLNLNEEWDNREGSSAVPPQEHHEMFPRPGPTGHSERRSVSDLVNKEESQRDKPVWHVQRERLQGPHGWPVILLCFPFQRVLDKLFFIFGFFTNS